MFRFKLLPILIVMIAALPALAEDHLIDVSYWNWGESLQMSKDGSNQDSNANFSAVGFEYEFSSGPKNRGWSASLAGLIGQATGGDANGDIIYVASYQKFFGAAAKVNWFWRIEKRIYLEFGPVLLFRPFTWPTSGDGISAESGSMFNYGASASLRIRVSRDIDFCQSIGALLVRSNSLWSAGLGYRF